MSSEQDRELLELAAKAAGIELQPSPFLHNRGGGALTSGGKLWNPLTSDAEALRLAVKLGIDVEHSNGFVIARRPDAGECSARARSNRAEGVAYDGDPLAATRRAITRAAAALAKGEGKV